MTVSSQQSFAAFVHTAWSYLTGAGANLVIDEQLQGLYDAAAAYNPGNVAAKVALTRGPLYSVMTTCMGASWRLGTRRVRAQRAGSWLSLSSTDLEAWEKYYGQLAAGQSVTANDEADRTVRRYLHVYPAPEHTTIANNWRIEINLLPTDIALGMAALVPLLDQYPDIGHMKFYMPGGARKPDSVIVYLRKQDSTYTGLQAAVLGAVRGLQVQARMGAMVDEIANGIGLASEPPKSPGGAKGSGGSFTAYRVLAIYIAFENYNVARGTTAASEPDFTQYLTTQTMPLLGLDPAQPHAQSAPPTNNSGFAAVWSRLQALRKIWKE